MLTAEDLKALFGRRPASSSTPAAVPNVVPEIRPETTQATGSGHTTEPVAANTPAKAPGLPVDAPETSTPPVTTPAPAGAPEANSEPKLALPSFIIAEPWSHQIEGVSFAVQTLGQYGAVLLAAEMGVGKTCVALLSSIIRGARRILIVAPKRVLQSWSEQLPRYLAKNSYVLAVLDDEAGTCEKRAEFAADRDEYAQALGRLFIVSVNYDAFWRDPLSAWIKSTKWDSIIYDESHRLKSPGGKASKFAQGLRAISRDVILATGTPLAHSPLDIFAQFRAGMPWIWGTNYASFRARYAKMGGPQKTWVMGYQRVDELEARMAPLTWRKTKAEALPYLPSETVVEYSTEFSPAAKKIYDQLEKEFVTYIDGSELTAANVLVKLLRLAQVTGGAVPTDDHLYHVVDDAKRRLLADTLEDVYAPVVIFARFRSDIDFCHQAIEEADYNQETGEKKSFRKYEISGSANDYHAWKAAAAAWNADTNGKATPPALVVQLQSGSEGISLVEASTAIYYSLTPRLIEFDQSRARLHRPGQKNAVTYIYLTVKGTVDQKVLASLLKRKDAIEEIMQSVHERRTGGVK
jgi:SNF2 family DNA or RNA helicase